MYIVLQTFFDFSQKIFTAHGILLRNDKNAPDAKSIGDISEGEKKSNCLIHTE